MTFEEEITIPLVDDELRISTFFKVKENLWKRFLKACENQKEEPKEVILRQIKSYVIADDWARSGNE